jgi:hypothetical protein
MKTRRIPCSSSHSRRSRRRLCPQRRAMSPSTGWKAAAPPLAQGVSFGVPVAEGRGPEGPGLLARLGGRAPFRSRAGRSRTGRTARSSGPVSRPSPGRRPPGPLKLSAGAAAAAPGLVVKVHKSETTVDVDTGALKCRIPLWGDDLIDSIAVGGRVVARNARLVCILQNGPDGGPADAPLAHRVQRARRERDGRAVRPDPRGRENRGQALLRVGRQALAPLRRQALFLRGRGHRAHGPHDHLRRRPGP